MKYSVACNFPLFLEEPREQNLNFLLRAALSFTLIKLLMSMTYTVRVRDGMLHRNQQSRSKENMVAGRFPEWMVSTEVRLPESP